MLGRQRDILEGHPKNKPIFVTLAKAIIKRSASEVHIQINTAVACSVAYTILFQLNTFPFTKSISLNSCLICITCRTFHSPPHFPIIALQRLRVTYSAGLPNPQSDFHRT